jgi:class 3 adenylate cyclase
VAESPREPGRRTLLATVVFVDIVEYSTRVVAQQLEQKTRLNEMIARALEQVPVADRMTVDTGDGAALCFLGDPEDALVTATNLRAAAGGALALRLGINLGPVKVVKDVNGRPNIIGDGINDAQRIMSFAQPNQILVSRSYYEVLSRLSQEYSRLFAYVGLHRDKHVREHEVYAVADEASGPPAAAPAPEAAPARETVVATEFVPPRSTGSAAPFDAAVLGRLEAVLADCIGPLARVIVRKAGASAIDLPQLVRALSSSVPESKRAAFARQVDEIAGQPTAPPAPAVPSAPAPAGAAVPERLSAELLARATDSLAVYIGPVAKILVKKTAEQATSARDLYQRLAGHIDDPAKRDRFIATAPEGTRP